MENNKPKKREPEIIKATYMRRCSFCQGYGHLRVAGKLRKCVCCNGKGSLETPTH